MSYGNAESYDYVRGYRRRKRSLDQRRTMLPTKSIKPRELLALELQTVPTTSYTIHHTSDRSLRSYRSRKSCSCRYDILCRICVLPIQPSKHKMFRSSGFHAATGYVGHVDHTAQGSICPGTHRSSINYRYINRDMVCPARAPHLSWIPRWPTTSEMGSACSMRPISLTCAASSFSYADVGGTS